MVTIAILAGHGRGLIGPAFPRFFVPQDTYVHFLWKFMCTYNDPVTVLPPIIQGAIDGRCRETSVKTSDDYEAVHGPGTLVHEHYLLPTPKKEREGWWDPQEVANHINGYLPTPVLRVTYSGATIELFEAFKDHRRYVVVAPFDTADEPIKLSGLLETCLREKYPADKLHVYWWACRSPGTDHGNPLAALYYGKWKRFANTYAPRDKDALKKKA